MKKILSILLTLVMVIGLAFTSMAEETKASERTLLTHEDWAPDVKDNVNQFLELYGKGGEKYYGTEYAVFDFDNTCSIFDVEEQLAVYQLQTMTFAITPEELPDVLFTEIGDHNEDRTDLGYGNGSYADWVDDITKAYKYLYKTYGPFTAEGLDEAGQKEIQADPQWAEFATKMRAMYDLVYDAESAAVAYPWVLYWFTGMTEQEVYDLAYASHSFYKEVETSTVTWATPEEIDATSKVGHVEYEWTSGTQVSENIKELWAALQANGIDVWVCSASATDPIRAAIDVWGLHDYCKGMLAMTNVLEDGKYVNAYDYNKGCGWYAKADGKWVKMKTPEGAQTQGVGKVTAIANAIAPQYGGHGPIAGFMDSTGDYNFCTEFDTLKLVICFNRASRKVTDGGGVISEVAMYERDTLGYDFKKADEAGDTMYLLQGREENGLRGLRPSNYTMLLGKTEEKLFKNEDNEAQLKYIIDNKMTVAEVINKFAMKTAADAEGNDLGFKYGFLKEYGGYHMHSGAPAKRLARADWAPDVRQNVNLFLNLYGKGGKNYKDTEYAVFDFDNTCSIFDVEEQLAVYQLQTMTFAITPEQLPEVLFTEIGDHDEDRTDLGYGNGSYADWVDDITAAYTYLYETYGPFTAAGLDAEAQAKIQEDPQWAEFATKMRAMYDLVYDAESASVAYPWVLYWFTGMTEQEVYDLAYASHSFYKAVETSLVTWATPEEIDKTSKVGHVEYTWTSGTQVSENIKELWKTLQENGIDVWVCSASATDPIRAAIDVWGLHEYCTGMLAMTNVLKNGKYVNAYDYEKGCGWYADADGKWTKMTTPEGAQTQGVGKVTAIANAIAPEYGNHGPIAGFMDSTGDYNFCTEFDTLKLVICFNRASRKVTDGGGVISEVAMYEKNNLKYNFVLADANGDTMYLLQGREENGLRGLRPSNSTMLLGKDEEKLFKNEDNEAQLQYIIDNKMTVEEVINKFAMKTSADAERNPLGFKYGFLKEYGGYHKHTGVNAPAKELSHPDWADDVKANVNEFLKLYGEGGKNYYDSEYAVFDFDNTCSIFDVEEQLAVYQLQTMTFAITPEQLPEVLFTEIGDHDEDRTDLGYGNGSYADWVDDITAAYEYLYSTYGPFTAAGLDKDAQKAIQADPQWKEFATKMRAMYDLVYDAESASVAYPWVLYWFTGMTEKEVYDLAYASHSYYKTVKTSTVTWATPEEIDKTSKVGHVEYTWTSGTQVSDNIKELWKTLKENGIDVWVCSASATDPIRAAIDVWGLHEYCTGMLAMTNVLEDGKYVNAYDYDNGCGWYALSGGEWEKMTEPEGAQTQGIGKVEAITNAIAPEYEGHGPIAGFMDSTGDFNFCTEFETLKLVICFNRASRKVTDGGGVISEVAMYERDNLNYDFVKADKAGDTMYLLQGREENGLRGLRPSNSTMLLGKTEEKLFKNDDNEAQLKYIIEKRMTVEDIINTFAIKTAADAEGNELGFKYGFLKEYGGYHQHP
ncbi:MAG: hypothetical protein MJ059_06775 [Lachnospiraceae bacterium]|nr:hypothetical protein [Lachnospiraceae bacterium]